ncbi:MAG TPA: hypothetical protein VGI32_11915 [Steroidobacteraceae bacterium]|jgi:hypothetical protein
MEIRRSITAVIAAAPFCLFAILADAQTINFGDSLPGGPVAAGYGGFQWGTGANQAINYVSDVSSPYFLVLTSPSAAVVEFDRTSLFDLNSVDFQILISGQTALDSFDNYSTVVSGYRGTTLVKSVAENYPGFGFDLFTGLNIDGVNRITFTTTDSAGFLDPDTGKPIVSAVSTYPGVFVDQLKVSNFQLVPEIDPASAVTALTLLLGGLAVLRGRAGPPAGRDNYLGIQSR